MTLADPDVLVAELDARLRRLEATVEDLGDAVAATPTADGKAAAAEPCYPTLDAWVGGWFAPTFARRLGQARWCARWWAHPEAVVRLEALWRTWEVLRLDPAFGMATWLREHLDPQRAILFGHDGPFQACEGEAAHHPPPDLPAAAAPADWRIPALEPLPTSPPMKEERDD